MKTPMLYFILALSFSSLCQNDMIIFLKDKGTEKSRFNLMEHVSKRSLIRRSTKKIAQDYNDIPVSSSYIQELATFGKVNKHSKWLNAVIYNSPMTAKELRAKFAFVERVVSYDVKNSTAIVNEVSESNKAINYGYAQSQIEQLNLNCLHDQGYTGSGIYLAIIDAGFTNMNNVSYFDSLFINNRVLDTWDFPLNSSNVFGNSSHGTMVSSCIVGEKHSVQQYVGTAKDVDIALYRSEIAATETISEEFDLVLALERCDSVGVDIANISLGYFGFDDSTTNHVYADMDGNTTIAALGVDVAASKGIAVVIAAGNGGPGKISTPCDADSCLCIGAVDSLSNYAFFSSVGPSSDGQVKPDVVARGFGAWVATPSDTVISGNGTSFASPITCGATACLMQANPTKSVQEVFNAIRQSADQFNLPDSLRGYGLPDFCLADQILKGTANISVNTNNSLLVFPNPTSGILRIEGVSENDSQVQILNTSGKVVVDLSSLNASEIDVSKLASGVYIIEIYNSKIGVARTSFIKE